MKIILTIYLIGCFYYFAKIMTNANSHFSNVSIVQFIAFLIRVMLWPIIALRVFIWRK